MLQDELLLLVFLEAHPSCYEALQLVNRRFFRVSRDPAVTKVWSVRHFCHRHKERAFFAATTVEQRDEAMRHGHLVLAPIARTLLGNRCPPSVHILEAYTQPDHWQVAWMRYQSKEPDVELNLDVLRQPHPRCQTGSIEHVYTKQSNVLCTYVYGEDPNQAVEAMYTLLIDTLYRLIRKQHTVMFDFLRLLYDRVDGFLLVNLDPIHRVVHLLPDRPKKLMDIIDSVCIALNMKRN